MNELMKNALVALTLCVLATGCKQNDAGSIEALSVDAEQESLEAVVDTFDKASEDFSDELEDQQEMTDVIDDVSVMTVDTAPENRIDVEVERSDKLKYCLFPAQKRMCVTNGTRSAKFSRFNDCLIKGTRFLAEGHVKLTFNNPRCGLKEDDMAVNRTYSLKLKKIGLRPLSYTIKSDNAKNYEGKTIGGGEYLENTAGGWLLNISGRHVKKFHARQDRPVGSVSVETLQPLKVIGTLRRPGRKITDGQVAVYHNIAEFKTIYTAEDLTWNSTCKCPVSGTLHIDVSGSKNGGGHIEFNSCGKATITRNNGSVAEKELPNCLIDEVE